MLAYSRTGKTTPRRHNIRERGVWGVVFRLSGRQVISHMSTSVGAVLLLSLATCFAIIVAATALILDLRQRELDRAKQTVVSLSRVLSDQTTRTFDSVLLTMRAARERLSDDIGSRLGLDNPAISYLLQARAAGLPQVKSIFLADSQGRGINSSRRDFVRNLSMQSRQLFRYHADGGINDIYISATERASVDGEWTYYVSIPLHDREEISAASSAPRSGSISSKRPSSSSACITRSNSPYAPCKPAPPTT